MKFSLLRRGVRKFLAQFPAVVMSESWPSFATDVG